MSPAAELSVLAKRVIWQLPRASVSLRFGTSLIKNSLDIKLIFCFSLVWLPLGRGKGNQPLLHLLAGIFTYGHSLIWFLSKQINICFSPHRNPLLAFLVLKLINIDVRGHHIGWYTGLYSASVQQSWFIPAQNLSSLFYFVFIPVTNFVSKLKLQRRLNRHDEREINCTNPAISTGTWRGGGC